MSLYIHTYSTPSHVYTRCLLLCIGVYEASAFYTTCVSRQEQTEACVRLVFVRERERESLVMEKKVSLKRVRPDSVYHFSTVV